jgi:hypothetical protein
MNSSNKCFNELNAEIHEAISKNDVNLIKKIMLETSYPTITQEEKEAEVFKNLRVSFNTNGTAKQLLEYLIFDYEISEEYNNQYSTKSSGIEHMFSLKKLNKEFN